MEFSEREITLLFKPGVKKDKNTYVLASQITPHIKEIDVFKDKLTETQLITIVSMLGIEVEKIVERESELYKEKYDGKSFDDMGWISVLVQNPELIKTPIAIKGKKALLIETPSNVLDLDPDNGNHSLKK